MLNYHIYQYYICFDKSREVRNVRGNVEKTLYALMWMKDDIQYLTLNEHQQVKSIEDVAQYRKNAIVNIGVAKKYGKSILERLKELGYDKTL